MAQATVGEALLTMGQDARAWRTPPQRCTLFLGSAVAVTVEKRRRLPAGPQRGAADGFWFQSDVRWLRSTRL